MWTKELAGIFTNEVIAIEGQKMRGAKRTGQSKSPIHIVSAWALEMQRSPGLFISRQRINGNRAEAIFRMELLDFGIDRPMFMGIKVVDAVLITVEFDIDG